MSEWRSNTLGELVTFQKGRKVKTSMFPLPGYAKYLGAGALSGKHDGYGSVFLSVQANENDILMLWDGERSGLSRGGLSGVVSSTVCKLSPTGLIISDLLYYFLIHNFEWIQNRRTGTGVPHVPKDIGQILEITYPSKREEQQKIAHILQTIDQAIEHTDALINKYQQIKAGLMHDLFTRGIGPDGQLRPTRDQAPDLYQQTPIGWIPKKWEYSPIGRYIKSAQYGISSSLDVGASGIPVLRMNNIQSNSFDVTDLKYSNDPEAYKVKLSTGDVLYNRTNSIEHVGKTAIWKNELAECSFASYLVRLNLMPDKIFPEYFSHWMSQVSSQNALRVYATPGVQQVNINPTNLQRVIISLPSSMEEQTKIAGKVDAVDGRIQKEKSLLKKLQKQKSGLMCDLLSGSVHA
jgi:type I restriction enzyme S subunit